MCRHYRIYVGEGLESASTGKNSVYLIHVNGLRELSLFNQLYLLYIFSIVLIGHQIAGRLQCRTSGRDPAFILQENAATHIFVDTMWFFWAKRNDPVKNAARGGGVSSRLELSPP